MKGRERGRMRIKTKVKSGVGGVGGAGGGGSRP